MPPYNDSIKLLNEVIDNIRPNVEEVVAAKKVINELFGKVLFDEICKKNKLFSCIFKDLYYSGSSGEGTQIGNACEFDLNFVLDTTKLKEEFHSIPQS